MFGSVKNFFVLVAIFMLVSIASAQEGGGSGGSGGSNLENWQLTYHYSGVTVRDGELTGFFGPQIPARPLGVDPASMVCTTTVTANWIGAGARADKANPGNQTLLCFP